MSHQCDRCPQLIRYQIRPEWVLCFLLGEPGGGFDGPLELCSIPNIQPDSGFVAVDIPKRKPQTIWLQDILQSRLCRITEALSLSLLESI